MKERNTLFTMIIHFKGSPRERSLSFPVYRQCLSKNTSERTAFHEQNMTESPKEESTDPSNRSANKDHHTDLILIPSIKHPTSFVVNYKKDSNIMAERDASIVCQQNRKASETKDWNNHNHRKNNLSGNKETEKSNRQQYQENKILQFKQGQQQQVNSKEKPLQNQIMTKQKKKKVIIVGDSMIKNIDGYRLTSPINHNILWK